MDDFLEKLKKVLPIVLYGPTISQSGCRKAGLYQLKYNATSSLFHFIDICLGLQRSQFWRQVIHRVSTCNFICPLSLTISLCLFAESSSICYANHRLGHYSHRYLQYTIRKLQPPFCYFSQLRLQRIHGFTTHSHLRRSKFAASPRT